MDPVLPSGTRIWGLKTCFCRTTRVWYNWREMETHEAVSARGTLISVISLSLIESTRRRSPLSGALPRRWLLISWPYLYREVTLETLEITSWAKFVICWNPIMMQLRLCQWPATSARARWQARAMSSWWHSDSKSLYHRSVLGFITNSTRDTSLRSPRKGVLTRKGWEPPINFCLVFPQVFTS